MGGDDDKIRISLPQDRAMRHRIDTMAKFVAVDGEAFEQVSHGAPSVRSPPPSRSRSPPCTWYRTS